MNEPVEIANGQLRVSVNPGVGGTITSIVHAASGLSVLGTVPWEAINVPIARFGARDEVEWLTRYTGGWPLLFPNGGDACTADGMFHGFHGEASISSWSSSGAGPTLRLARQFHTVPVEMIRDISLTDDRVAVREEVRMQGSKPVDVMWGHHPTFGSDLIAGPVEITTSAERVSVDETYDPAANPLIPGATGAWPALPGKRGPYDLSRPAAPLAALAYLHGFDPAWVALRRLDNAIAVTLSWDARRFPCAWLWFELGGTLDAPWHGRCNLIGIEPNTTRPACGLARAAAQGGHLMRLEPGSVHETTLALRVFRPAGRIEGVQS